jgi:hypothetical protein
MEIHARFDSWIRLVNRFGYKAIVKPQLIRHVRKPWESVFGLGSKSTPAPSLLLSIVHLGNHWNHNDVIVRSVEVPDIGVIYLHRLRSQSEVGPL